MAFALTDRWVWDAWYVRDGMTTHMFYLNAPKTLRNPDHRHFYATIGHATSDDHRNWQVQPRALGPAESPSWDDFATWTGSVIKRPDGQWMMFYTGISRAERGHVQRIGAALSNDLFHWERTGGEPLIEADPQFYETSIATLLGNIACRDPFIFADPDGNGWHMVYTARSKSGPIPARGVIGHAWSPDLDRWETRPPLWSEGLYGELEVPDIFELNGRWYLLFSTAAHEIAPDFRELRDAPPETGCHYLTSDTGPLGPWCQIEDRFALGDTSGTLYVARVLPHDGGQPAVMAFQNLDPDGQFVGALTDPMPVSALTDGRLRIDGRSYGIADPDTRYANPVLTGRQ